MPYSFEDLKKLGIEEKDFASLPVATLQLFDIIKDINFSAQTLDTIDYSKELYLEYLKDIQTLGKTNKTNLLKDYKYQEIFANHTLECESYDDLISFNETHNSIAFNYLFRKLIHDKKPLNEHIIAQAYKILMRGTSSYEDNSSSFRTSNSQVVGYENEGKPVIQFLPLAYNEIDWAIAYLAAYFNAPEENEIDLLTKPFIIHGLIASLQMFKDGNTRFARTFQYLKIFMLTKKFIDDSLTMPTLYFSNAYLPYRKQYRDLIARIVQEHDNAIWNEWIIFNLRRMQDQIFLNEDTLRLYRNK